MKSDIHFTTCHHSSVKCRPRTNDYKLDGFNITPWTTHDKLMIANKSLVSLSNFCNQQISIIDDGSDYEEALDWLELLRGRPEKFRVLQYEHRGSSAGLNDYLNLIDDDTDLICHFEDDHIYFNPEKLDWKQICYDYLTNNRDVGVVTFRSGLPTNPSFPDFKGVWGPIAFRDGQVPAFIFRCMGNAHHIMLAETYRKFFPLQGNAGSCEAYMNNKLQSLGLLNAELQIPVYAFHSHCWKRDLPELVTTDELNMSPRGREYGIFDMAHHIEQSKTIEYMYYISEDEKVSKCWPK